MLILIAGQPNSGKTYCMNYLKQKYNSIFIVDEYVLSIYKFGEIGYEIIKNNFGSQFVNDVEVDKLNLSKVVLEDKKAYQKLCDLIWPVIRNKLIEIKQSNINYIVEMAIYAIDDQNYFANIFDLTIQIKPMFKVVNEKNKFEQLYFNTTKNFDHCITNKNNNEYIDEIIKIIDAYFC